MATKGFIRVLYGESLKGENKDFEAEFRENILSNYSDFCSIEAINGAIKDNLVKHIYNGRLEKIKDNIRRAMEEKIKFEFVCYTFGTENHKHLLSLGINSVLVNKFSNPYYMYRHKLEAIRLGMEEFDEIVYLDWDTKPIKEIDDYFWELLQQKAPVQASLSKYRSWKLGHRIGRENRFCPSGAFFYCREKSIPNRMINLWKTNANYWSDEPAIALVIDEIMGKWDIEKYFERFEPLVFTSPIKCPFRFNNRKETNLHYFGNKGHPHRY